VHALRTGGKVLCVGNGGSACDAAHFAEELTGRFRADRPPIAALACSDAGHITCTANDYGFEHVFARWVLALGRAGDVLLALSTSGNSANVLRAIDAALERRMTVITLLGRGGGAARGRGTVDIIVPGDAADRVQELHKLVLHTMVEGIEYGLGYAPRG
jgi:D-sedoheptulose 7-phosphate isomerase